MICPSCSSANPDDVRFCLHCGQYQGEPDETTFVRPPRVPPQTTIAAALTGPSLPTTYEPPRKRKWPFWTAFLIVVGIGCVGAGLIAIVAIHSAGGFAVDLPDNTRVTVFSKETSSPSPVRAAPVTVNRAEPPPLMDEPSPTPKIDDSVVLTWSGWLADGRQMAWNLPSGRYGVEFTASGDGGTVEVSGSDNCFKTKPMLRFRQRCDLPLAGSLVITNPTVFATGAAISASVRVVRLREE